MKIETLPLSALKPYGRNARTHSRRQIKQIAKSMERFGFCNPILIDDDKQIIAGHGRAEAAKLIGMTAVPTVRLSHLSEADKRAYILADNKLAEKAGWDREILTIELQALVDLDFDFETIGFEAAEVDMILEDASESSGGFPGPEDDVPPFPQVTTTLAGDLWVLGKHRLLCADAREKTSYDVVLEGAKAEFVFTDPPYNVPIDGHVCGLGRVRHANFAMACGEMSEQEFVGFLGDVFSLLAAHTLDGSIHQICMDWRHLGEMCIAGRRVYSELKNLCVWNKNNAGMGTFYRSKHELIFVWKSGKAPHVNNFELGQHGRSRSNVWDYAGVNTFRAGRLDELAMHPTVKPVALIADAIKDCSRAGHLVLDPFAGSGSTLIAAERTGRQARALEIDPHYVDVAVKRWERFTGKIAVLAASGERFDDISDERAMAKAAAEKGVRAAASSSPN
jgi:DNA modification methylase